MALPTPTQRYAPIVIRPYRPNRTRCTRSFASAITLSAHAAAGSCFCGVTVACRKRTGTAMSAQSNTARLSMVTALHRTLCTTPISMSLCQRAHNVCPKHHTRAGLRAVWRLHCTSLRRARAVCTSAGSATCGCRRRRRHILIVPMGSPATRRAAAAKQLNARPAAKLSS